ncbi:MAG: GFA family protein [Nocardioidaceae bacterium]
MTSTGTVPPRATGHCLCGAVGYRISGTLRDVFDCHCARCRRFTGHHMAATAAATADVEIDDPGSNLQWYFPVPGAGYGFCSRCGSSMFWRAREGPESLSVCAGTLDLPTGLHTTAAWWASEAGDYYTRPDLPELATE